MYRVCFDKQEMCRAVSVQEWYVPLFSPRGVSQYYPQGPAVPCVVSRALVISLQSLFNLKLFVSVCYVALVGPCFSGEQFCPWTSCFSMCFF